MGTEVEHKFLVRDDSWQRDSAQQTRIVQGYLARDGRATVRVRIRGQHGFLTIKGPSVGVSRSEFEYEIPLLDAEQMLTELSAGPTIEKTRHLVNVGNHTWEVDVFAGANAPLVLAEVELTEAGEPFECPPWAGEDVSADPRYFNSNLAQCPYGTW
jgi:adenylate cyclase